MLTIKNYIRPETLEEAYNLCQKRSNVVLGGMLWLKMSNRTVKNAIDLCDLGLDKIIEEDDCYKIGAMVSLRTLEMHDGLNSMTNGAFKEALKHIVGVQFRNVATLGGSVYGRFGFSDVFTLLQVLEAKVCLYKNGEISINEFAQFPRNKHDILTDIIIPKKKRKVAYLSQRNTKTDFPSLACAVAQTEDSILCSVGARPGLAGLYRSDSKIFEDGINEENAMTFGNEAAMNFKFDSNMRGSSEYRQRICKVLVKRGLMSFLEVDYAD